MKYRLNQGRSIHYRLSRERPVRCLRWWEMQAGEGPTLVEAEWGWLVGTWGTNGSKFKVETVTVRHPTCSWWGRVLTRPTQTVWVLALGRGVEITVVYEAAAISVLCLTLMAMLPMWGVIGSFLLATATVLAVSSAITVARGRRLRSVSTSSEHGRHVLQLASDVDHATLWSAAVDPDVAAMLAHGCELPSYDQTPLVAEGSYELYQPPTAEQDPDRLT